MCDLRKIKCTIWGELQAELEEVLEDLEDNLTTTVDAVYIPPSDIEASSDLDESDFEEGEDFITNDDDYSDDAIVGSFEIQIPEQGDAEPKRHAPAWIKNKSGSNKLPVTRESDALGNLEGKTPLEVFELFFDARLLSSIVEFSNKYAADEFKMSVGDLKKFLGILIMTSLVGLPSLEYYWSGDLDMMSGCVLIIQKSMSLSKFKRIKSNLHLSDKSLLDKSDKYAKIRTFFNEINVRFMQFGMFACDLSIGELMVPYFDRHYCKLKRNRTIRRNPVRFGYKLWSLCSSNGYMYHFQPYDDSNDKYELGLGGHVVFDLLRLVKNPGEHRIFFNRFFASYQVFARLSEQGYLATARISDQQTAGCPLESTRDFFAKPKGTTDVAFDETTGLTIVRYKSEGVATIASNNLGAEPVPIKTYCRKQRKNVTALQPELVVAYKEHRGGVALHDNSIDKYRVRVNDKKWWWALFTNVLNSAVVNSWKLYRTANSGSKMDQTDFRLEIATRLMEDKPCCA